MRWRTFKWIVVEKGFRIRGGGEMEEGCEGTVRGTTTQL